MERCARWANSRSSNSEVGWLLLAEPVKSRVVASLIIVSAVAIITTQKPPRAAPSAKSRTAPARTRISFCELDLQP